MKRILFSSLLLQGAQGARMPPLPRPHNDPTEIPHSSAEASFLQRLPPDRATLDTNALPYLYLDYTQVYNQNPCPQGSS